MKTYTGTKTLQAEPMTRGDYNEFRGWDLPDDEDGEDQGYRVEYPDGYVSWSPADQFEAAYRLSGTYQERLVIERDDLVARRNALEAYLVGNFGTERSELQVQLNAMNDYLAALTARI